MIHPSIEADVFDDETLHKVLKENKLTEEVATKLLNLYVWEADWWPHILRFYAQAERKFGELEAKEKVKEAVAFTILLPAHDRSVRIDTDHPENNLFRWPSFHQFDQKEWFTELQKVIRQDSEIADNRREVLHVGVIDPIDYQPYCRQGYKWLCEHAEEDGVELTNELREKFRRLVMVYGGAVVSYMFEKHKPQISKIANWRSAYFFERAIYQVYSLDQIMKIKQAEIKKTNPKFVKAIRKV